ncbi:MAG: CRISPR-associated protein Cas4 [Saprospiraceae bacterium]|nr:MAG: CRISPR-associated protein Cas4 [Saprospiraceae bacterium]
MLSITPSQIIEFLYCPRYTYYEYVLHIPQQEEKYYKVMRGRELHLERARQNVDYLRKRIGVVDKQLNQYLTNELLRGEVDEVLWLKDGSMAPLDYKFARFEGKVYETYKTQLYCYAWLIRENFGKPVNKGFIVYTRSQNKLVEIMIEDTHVQEVEKAATSIGRIIQQNIYPRATKYKKRCVNCTYRNVCIK